MLCTDEGKDAENYHSTRMSYSYPRVHHSHTGTHAYTNTQRGEGIKFNTVSILDGGDRAKLAARHVQLRIKLTRLTSDRDL